MPLIPNRGSTINRNNTGPQANVPGLHTPRGTLTQITGARTISDDATYTGIHYTGTITITGNPTFVDCWFTGRITLDTRGINNITNRSARFEWCLFGDPDREVAGSDPNPGFIRGNVTCYRCRSCMYNDHFQIDSGHVRIVEHLFDGLYKGDSFTFGGQTQTGTGVAHNDFIQLHYIGTQNDSDDTTIQDVIVQDSMFATWTINTGQATGANDGEATVPSSRRATSSFAISNPGASGGVDTRRRNQSTWMVFRGNHYVGHSDRVLHVTARSAVGADRQVAVIDNIIEGNSQSGHSNWFSFFNASGAAGANPRVFFGRNQDRDGNNIALPTNAEAAAASTEYPRISTFDTPGSGGGGGGGGTPPPAPTSNSSASVSLARPLIGSYADSGSDAPSGLTGDYLRGIGPITLPENTLVKIDRFYFRGDGAGSAASGTGGSDLWSLTSGDAATALPNNGGGNRAVGNVTTTGGRAVASIRKNANGTMGWHTIYRSSADSLANGLRYSGTFRLDAIPDDGQQWIAYYLSTTADETSEFGQSSNINSLGFLIGVHPPSSLYLIRKNANGSQTQIATGVELPSNLGSGSTDFSWTFTVTATTATIDFNGTELSGNHGLSWTSATWYQQYQNSNTSTSFQVSFTGVDAETITGGTSGATQLWRGVVYADDNGEPGEILDQTDEGTITAGDAADTIYYSPPLGLEIDTTTHPSIHLYVQSGGTGNVGQINRLEGDNTYTFGFGTSTFNDGAEDNPTLTTSFSSLPRIWAEYQEIGRRRFASGTVGAGTRGAGTRG